MGKNRQERNHLYIKTSMLGLAILVLVNLIPDEMFHIFSIYRSTTPTYIRYDWLHYSFGIFELVLLIYGVFLSIKHRRYWIWMTALFLIIRELFFFFSTESSVIATGRYEIYITLLVGIALIQWQIEYGEIWEDKWNFFSVVLIANVLSIFLNVVLSRNGIIGRYNASNLDVGTTGVVAGMTFVAMLLNTGFPNHLAWTVISGIGLILSGSRVNLLITFVVSMIILLVQLFKKLSTKASFKMRVSSFLVAILGILAIIVYGNKILQRLSTSRILTIIDYDNLDDVMSGRPASFTAGLAILRKNPLGISAHFINLQSHSIQEGFGTFPHFGLLVLFVFFGPLVLIPLYEIIKSVINLYKLQRWTVFVPVIYLLIYNVFAGGPIVNPKTIYLFGSVFAIGYLASKGTDNNVQRVESEDE